MTDAPDTPRRALAGHAEPLDHAKVIATGEALFGREWVAPLARALEINERTVLRWKQGTNRVPPHFAPILDGLLAERAAQLTAARRALKPDVERAAQTSSAAAR